MTKEIAFPIVAVEIGNSRIKLGLFLGPAADDELPRAERKLTVDSDGWEPVEIALWLAPRHPSHVTWVFSSVRRDAATRLMTWLDDEGANHVDLTHQDLPLYIGLAEPERVGIDRLVGAVAANRLRPSGQPAIIVDLGSAITVDVVSSDGTFCGGAILPGISMSARALSEFTDQLPQLSGIKLDKPPPALGTSTNEAITSGLYWGAVGAIRTLVAQLHQQLSSEPLVFLTGGGAESVAGMLDLPVCFQPDLLLAGIALSIVE